MTSGSTSKEHTMILNSTTEEQRNIDRLDCETQIAGTRRNFSMTS
jgi:hypothetical protein